MRTNLTIGIVTIIGLLFSGCDKGTSNSTVDGTQASIDKLESLNQRPGISLFDPGSNSKDRDAEYQKPDTDNGIQCNDEMIKQELSGKLTKELGELKFITDYKTLHQRPWGTSCQATYTLKESNNGLEKANYWILISPKGEKLLVTNVEEIMFPCEDKIVKEVINGVAKQRGVSINEILSIVDKFEGMVDDNGKQINSGTCKVIYKASDMEEVAEVEFQLGLDEFSRFRMINSLMNLPAH